MSIRVHPLFLILLALALLSLVAACGGGGGGAAQPTAPKAGGGEAATQPPAAGAGQAAAGDPTNGKAIFASAGCGGCHKIAGNAQATGAVGPDLSKIGTDASTIIKDPKYTGKAKTPEDFMRESIVDPNVYIAPTCPSGPCQPNVMPKNFKDTLGDQKINDLVAYLMSLK